MQKKLMLLLLLNISCGSYSVAVANCSEFKSLQNNFEKLMAQLDMYVEGKQKQQKISITDAAQYDSSKRYLRNVMKSFLNENCK